MNFSPIPQWTAQGVLPPINEDIPISHDRSPYEVSLTDVVCRYSLSPERNTILSGFLKYRADLHEVGFVKGFQWIDGSFLENIRLLEKREPQDMDVVTFGYMPSGKTQDGLLGIAPDLFKPLSTKAIYHVDAYFVPLNEDTPESLVKKSIYWYSLWSHRRDGQWKGYLQVDLSPYDDLTAKAILDNSIGQGGQP